jgi:autotransporter-associated beta strand protein
VSLFVGAKGAFRKDSTLTGLSAGFDAALGQGLHLIGDGTVLVSGNNTYSTATANRERRGTYGVALRYTPPGQQRNPFSVDLGITNAIGTTTAFSMTPALGNNIGFYAAATVRF